MLKLSIIFLLWVFNFCILLDSEKKQEEKNSSKISDAEFQENKIYYVTKNRNFYVSIDNGSTWSINHHPFDYTYTGRNRTSPCQF